MRNTPTSTIARPASATRTRSRRPRSRFWLGGTIAVVGLVAGVVFGITSYRDAQQQIDIFARTSIPGVLTVQVDEPGLQVVYIEGDPTPVIGDLAVTVTDPTGATVVVDPFEDELIYETADLTQGRAMATFTADQPGEFQVAMSGAANGEFTVGESFTRLALPGVLGGLAIAGLSVIAGLAIWLSTFLKRQTA